ncbi:MFS transporter [Arenibaculum pallidiluteum]|uniref:MFS transporter n=1 Tax=Arenibaculum pallidiluteum TaxID=2812559 RepID=UPI001A9791F0|nr:MFS transporter [Arenibaculum pallidiluteum]
MNLKPDSVILPSDVERGKRALVQDGAWANVVGTLSGGVMLVGLALALGAGPRLIGVLAAIPFFAQLAQIPAIGLVERIRQRRKIAVLTITGGRVLILGMACLPLIEDRSLALGLLVAGQVCVGVLGAVGACSWNSWMHEFLPREGLGTFFARRLFWATSFALISGLAVGAAVDHWPSSDKADAYSAAFVMAALAGFVSSWWLSRVPEPVMAPREAQPPLLRALREPFQDPDFRQLIVFMVSWNFATNLAAPFFTVYLLQQLGFGMGEVVVLWAVSQLANALTLGLWGRLSDQLSNKSILGLAAPVFLGCVLALPFSALPERHAYTFPILILIHAMMGAATGGTGLAVGNIGLKMAPSGRATAYLAAVSLSGSLAAGIAPIVGGLFAEWFAAREFSLVIHWMAPEEDLQAVAMRLRNWEFFFVFAFLLGLYALHALTLLREGAEASDRNVVRQFRLELRRSMRSLSSVGGLRVATAFPVGRFVDRDPGAPQEDARA